jgi:hypothetical protein
MNFPERPDMYQEDELELPAEFATGPAWIGLIFIIGIFVAIVGLIALVLPFVVTWQ